MPSWCAWLWRRCCCVMTMSGTGCAPRPPASGTAIVTDKGLSGQDTEAFFTSPDLCLTLIRPARKDEKAPRYFPNWLRQRVEAIIWTLNLSGLHCGFVSVMV